MRIIQLSTVQWIQSLIVAYERFRTHGEVKTEVELAEANKTIASIAKALHDHQHAKTGVLNCDWRPIRRAIEAAYVKSGVDVPSNIPPADWNFAADVILAYEEDMKSSCSTCKRTLHPQEVIRCLDCKTALCDQCAPNHFWPNGRKKPTE